MAQHSFNPYDHVLAKSDGGYSYEAWGYVCWEEGGQVHIDHYSHCSCYGTFDSLNGTRWSGSREEALDMARRRADPAMPERVADKSDYDYRLLIEMYDQLIETLTNDAVTSAKMQNDSERDHVDL